MQIGAPPGTAFGDTSVVASTTYRYRVRATDAAGNLSAYSGIVAVTTPSTVPTTGLVAAYSFDEGSGTTVSRFLRQQLDRHDHERDVDCGGQIREGAVVQRLECARDRQLTRPRLRLTTAMTLEAWVNPTTVSSAWRDVIYKGDDNYYLEGTSMNAGRPGGGGTFSATPLYAATTLVPNTWTHLALTYDGAALRIYFNGVLASTQAASGNHSDVWQPAADRRRQHLWSVLCGSDRRRTHL